MHIRVGDHSSAVDGAHYRSVEEVKYWEKYEQPISRLRYFMLQRDWWSEKEEATWLTETRKQAWTFSPLQSNV